MTLQEFVEKGIKKLNYHHMLNWMPDKMYLKIMYWANMHKKLNLNSPKTFNEKLQWLKLYDRNPEYVRMVDKCEAKNYIAEVLGEQYIIPTLGIWEHFEDIDFIKLPNQFVLKCVHDSGGLVICKDKSKLNLETAKKTINSSLKTNYYWNGREWPYKNIRPRIIAEQYMEDSELHELRDYKFFCFNGNVESVMVCMERNTGSPKFYFFDKEWNLKKYNKRGKDAPEGFTLPKPKCMDDMFYIAEKLSKGIPYVRVDLYCINKKIYFGEMTFYPDSGFDANLLPESDAYWGKMLVLPEKRGTKR